MDVHSPAGIARSIGCTFLRQRQAVRVTPWLDYISVSHHLHSLQWVQVAFQIMLNESWLKSPGLLTFKLSF